MLPPLFDLSLIADHLAEGTIIITPNRRLSAQIHASFAECQVRQNRNGWQSPEIYPMEEWIEFCWHTLLISGHPVPLEFRVLPKTQELLLWEQVIRRDRESALLKPYATAKSAQSAYRLLELWNTSIGNSFNEHPDCARFAYWSRQFKQSCQRLGYITTGKMTAIVSDAFREGRLVAPQGIILAGFQQMPPAYTSLLEHTGAGLIFPKANVVTTDTCAQGYSNAEQELQMAAAWCKGQLENNPKQRIGIVIPDLKQRRAQVERIFTGVFEPQFNLPDTIRYQAPYNISAGTELHQMPVIQDALTLLKLNQQSIDVQDIFRLLRSPFLLQQEHWLPSLARFDLSLRQEGLTELSLSQLQQRVNDQKDPDSAVTAWSKALSDFEQAGAGQIAKKNPFATWVSLFREQLEGFNWPGQRRLDSIEYQQVKRWQVAMDELTDASELISEIRGVIGLEEAITLFNRSIASIEFQAESPAPSPLQILGMLEGGGLRFDALWIMGVNDHIWPPQPSPNPFIPVILQRTLAMPHASAERELEFTQALFHDYLCSAPKVVASYSMQDQDQPLAPSHLIDAFPDSSAELNELEPPEFPHPYYRPIKSTEQLQHLPDSKAPTIQSRSGALQGGTQILKNQAACPFKAFAIHRLGLRQVQEASNHILPSHRGNMLHRALELFWQKIKDLNSLRSLEREQLNHWIEHSVSHAVNGLVKSRPDLFNPRMVELEKSRLAELLSQWLDVEKQRTAFRVVATESASSVSIAGQTLQVRIDRVDQLADGSLAIIDYKSGVCSTRQWQGERLDEPQLPLYCVTFSTQPPEGEINTLTFAEVNIDRQGFVGISSHPDIGPGITTPETTRNWEMQEDWVEIKSQWQRSLEALMNEFIEGHANVDPKQAGSCQYCHLQTLCRIHDPRCFKEDCP